MVMKDLLKVENLIVLTLNVVRLSVRDYFSVIFDNICME